MNSVMTKLKYERERRKWNQQTLGFHASVAASDVSRIENRRMVPYDGQAERLAKVLGLKPEELQDAVEASLADCNGTSRGTIEGVKQVNEKQAQQFLESINKGFMEFFGNGFTEVEFKFKRSTIDTTEPVDTAVSRELGSVKFEIVMKNPNETRPETWE